MQYYSRKIAPIFNKYFAQKQVVVITGMRRVGKTTFLQRVFDQLPTTNKIFLSLENIFVRKIFDQTNYADVARSLEHEGVLLSQSPAYIFLDEIQLSPNIPSVIKYLYDQFGTKFVVTGSSSYYIKNHFTESLAGRKFVLELRPLTFSEFLIFKDQKPPRDSLAPSQPMFSLTYANQSLGFDQYANLFQEYLQYGGFPEVVLQKNLSLKTEMLIDIINSYFQIDVTTLAQFSDVPKLHDLLILLTQRIGQKLNVTNLASALQISRNQTIEYLELLKSTYVIDTLSQKSSVDNRVSADDKLYFTDCGLANTLAGVASGSLLENAVYMNLVYDYKLGYYQTKSGGEIDFVLDNQIALEVKETIAQSDLANLKKRCHSAGIEEYYLVGAHPNQVERSIMAWEL